MGENKNELVLLPLNERNAVSASMAITDMQTKLHEGLSIIADNQGTISMLLDRVAKLETALSIQDMNLVGLGPSVQ